jgi:hypothetical protein
MRTIITNYDNSNPPEVGDAVCIISCGPHGDWFKRYGQSINDSFEGRTGTVIAQRTDYWEVYAVKLNYGKVVSFNWQELFNIDL